MLKLKIDELSTVIDKSNCFLHIDAMDFRLDFEFQLNKMEMDVEEIRILKKLSCINKKKLLRDYKKIIGKY